MQFLVVVVVAARSGPIYKIPCLVFRADMPLEEVKGRFQVES